MLNRMEVNRATFYAIVLRVWQLAAGAVSLVLISIFFTPEVQGYYYTFFGLLALQSFFELGMHIVIIAAGSHQWADLRLDDDGRITGDASALSRLVSLGRLIAVWYAFACVLFVVVVGIAGFAFFSLKPSEGISWTPPWCLLVLLSGMLLWTLPFNALLEGCNQVATVNRFRLIQAIVANLAVWTAIILDVGLWAAVAATAARLICDLYLLSVRYRRFFGCFWRQPDGPRLKWRIDIWPMQWRIAISGVFSYFEFALFTPVMFYYQGSVIAGQMGMTWTLITAIQAAAMAWVQTRIPLFGMLIAKQDYRELDRVYTRLTAISIGALALGSLLVWGLVFGLYSANLTVAERLLPPLPTAILLAAVVLYQLPRCQEMYLRAHRREPFFLANVASSTIIGLLVWILGAKYGPIGVAWGYLAAVILFNVPCKGYLWARYRREWHET